MLRLYDARTGRLDELPRARFLRVHVGGLDLRSQVLGDVVRRLVERHRRQVLLTASGGRDLTPLNIPPTDQDAPGEADLYVGQGPGRLMEVSPTTVEPTLTRVAEQGLDPLSLRLAALEHPYREPLELGSRQVEEADRELRRLRESVAGWAEQPSKAMHDGFRAELMEALDSDLNTPAALGVMRRLAAAEIAPGSKFETFSYFDMVLALDLVREVGRSRPASR
ncbi:hypothetical protein [Actinomadura sp. HBU206391]|uniref:hypothetical protein n=1 Tax=Actinomadura sp. HBU206391 TaxID=2731692 RepID=UPI00164EE64F|nr:hypothetical protein [Actinomadura sp. HBU206391]MBC6457796.1 hypothetical protein [Actinomadura sp. HBU206391]